MVLEVIWDQIFVTKQGVILNHWGSVGVIGRSVGLSGGHQGSVELNERSAGLIWGHWGSVDLVEGSPGLSVQCMYTYLRDCFESFHDERVCDLNSSQSQKHYLKLLKIINTYNFVLINADLSLCQ